MTKLIPSLSGLYSISSDGCLIYSLYNKGRKRSRPLLLSPVKSKDGYMRISLTCADHKRRTFLVHRLVADAYLKTSPMEVNHINGVRHDNRAENLEYVSHSQNVLHSYNVLAHPRTGSKKTCPVVCVEASTLFLSMKSAAESVGGCDQGIHQAVTRGWVYKGFHWSRARVV